MKIIIKNICIVLSAVFLLAAMPGGTLNAEQLFFTYAGLTAGGGMDMIKYKDWISDREGQETKKVTGSYFCGGALIDIFVNHFIGEFTLQYISNINKDVPVSHIIYDAAGKYSYQLYPFLSLTAGAGLYIESRPATKRYDGGAGFDALIGAVYNLTRDWKLVFDIAGRFGSFGVGDESTRQSYGAKIGIVYKVGRI